MITSILQVANCRKAQNSIFFSVMANFWIFAGVRILSQYSQRKTDSTTIMDFDSVVYILNLTVKRMVLMGDISFGQNNCILNRCRVDVPKAPLGFARALWKML